MDVGNLSIKEKLELAKLLSKDVKAHKKNLKPRKQAVADSIFTQSGRSIIEYIDTDGPYSFTTKVDHNDSERKFQVTIRDVTKTETAEAA